MATTLKEQNLKYTPSEWEYPNCPFCNNNNFHQHEKFGFQHSYTYVKCNNCNLVYLNPRPKYDEVYVKTAYEVYNVEAHHVQSNGNLNKIEKKQVEQNKFILKQLENKLGRKGKILEIGCMTGLFLYAAKELNWDCVGIDISQSMVKHINDNFKITALCGQYHQLDLRNLGLFDVIYASHVIEHIPNPNVWMDKFKNDLKNDGILCLNVPNQYSIDRIIKRFLKILKLKKDNWAAWRTPDHIYEPHITSMLYLIQKNNYRCLDYSTYSRNETSPDHQSAITSKIQSLFHRKLKWGTKLRFILTK